jgi:tRNA nucleotidyltransferase (CCA-adding enzyme)
VRFGFWIQEPTKQAMFRHVHLLDGLAKERVFDELCKLLPQMTAEDIVEYAPILTRVIPELAPCVDFLQHSPHHAFDVYTHIAHVTAGTPPVLSIRLAALLHDIGKPLCYTEDEQGGHFKGHAPMGVEITREVLGRLRFDNETIRRMELLIEWHDIPLSAEKKRVKRLMQKLTDADILRLLEIKRCDRLAHAVDYQELPPELAMIPSVIEEIRAEDACLSLRTLAVSGDDLMALGIPRGKQIGEMLQSLLDDVIEERLPNEKNALLQAAKARIKKA